MKKLVYISVIALLIASSTTLTSCTIEEMDQYEEVQNNDMHTTQKQTEPVKPPK